MQTKTERKQKPVATVTIATAADASPKPVPLKRILADLNLPADGKAARRKLRKFWRTESGASELPHDIRNPWTFSEAQAAIARKLLTP